jgi:hypothetical protein
MSEDEIGEIRDELKAYKEQLDSLREDLTLLIRLGTASLLSTISLGGWMHGGNPGYNQEEVERCRKFSKKYKDLDFMKQRKKSIIPFWFFGLLAWRASKIFSLLHPQM